MADPLPFLPPGETADLTNCDREPIHLCGAIQPHGMLLVVDEASGRVTQASANTAGGLGVPEVLGHRLADLVGAEAAGRMRAHAAHAELCEPLRLEVHGTPYDLHTHRTEAGLTLELETLPEAATAINASHIGAAIRRLQKENGVADLAQCVAEQVRQLTGFDRVKVYRFDETWSGAVIAEARADHMPSYLGLHFPAFDIPRQARHLYTLNPTRLIADVRYTPVPIEQAATGEGAPLDLTHSALRSVSPLHVTYLQNMGVQASMSISILTGGVLWGLVACHHNTPLHVPAGVRQGCELLSQVLTIQLPVAERIEDAGYEVHLHSVQAKLGRQMSQSPTFVDGLTKSEPSLLDLVDATGAAVVFGGTTTVTGRTPSTPEIEALVAWLDAHHAHLFKDDAYSTASLPREYPPAEAFQELASGLLAVPLARQGAYVLWFRPEILQQVAWAGDPVKGREDALGRLQPRSSFAAWQQEVRGTSARWRTVECDVAKALRHAIVETVLHQAGTLAALNRDLQRSNEELDSFAYVASHDLKEPLRGIHNYAHFLIEDYHDLLDDEGRAKLMTVQRLTQRMDRLIDALMHYARLGRQDLARTPVPLADLLDEVLDVLHLRLEETGATVEIAPSLPTIEVDRVQMGEVFTNLLVNATKYTRGAPHITIAAGDVEAARVPAHLRSAFLARQITSDERPLHFITVRDRGIGIAPGDLRSVFKSFKRLHAQNQYGGGSGAGLAIVERVMQRHGGLVWVESDGQTGSTFCLLL